MTTTQTATVTHAGTSTVSPEIAARARQLLARRKRKAALDSTRLCAIIASLPARVKVQDIAPIYGLTATTLSKLRALAYRGAVAFPDALRPALEASFTPRKKA
jgi:hypothetical protein